jgi:CRP-like cAMP-binding protein
VILGERALLEGGKRTATLRAETPCKVAVVSGDQVSPDLLAELAGGHHREEA